MAVHIGVDLGSVSVKAALLSTDPADREFFESLRGGPLFERVMQVRRTSDGVECWLAVTPYRRVSGNPQSETQALLENILQAVGGRIGAVAGTGSGAPFLSRQFQLPPQNEFRAIARAVELLTPDVRTVFEMGGENSKYLLLEQDQASGRIGIADYSTNGDCAAGTGGFLDQQAGRLRFTVEQIGEIVLGTPRAAKIAGRCSVFAKSDMIHAQQKGFTPAEILKGLCEAVARNFKSSITRGKKVEPRVAFIGGVAANGGVVQALETVFEWPSGSLFIPELYTSFIAVGAAVLAADNYAEKGKPEKAYSLDGLAVEKQQFPHSQPLNMENVVLLRDRMPVVPAEDIIETRDAFLGIDIGSVSTNLVVLDEEMNVLKEIYLRTEARPIEAVSKGLKEIEADLGEKIVIRGVGTTGSGRELIGELVGADTVHDEITAHKTGAAFIGRTILDMQPETIFEIGGQDSKFISLEEGVVVDFAMNEACAAGTGSFLEERAKELGIQIKDEFSRTALSSRTPIRLGERCTVFMEQDVNAYIQHGAPLNDIVAGLAYSIATNYINRVVRGRKIGKVIFFQGGTAYNDSVAAAFSSILETRIIVPPFNGVMGALGVALLAREKMLGSKRSGFRGFDLEKVGYKMREFTCKGCTNFCQMQEFTVENERTYWGDKCSERYRKAVKVEREPVIDNLIEFRLKQLLAGYDPESGDGPVVGIPWTMSTYEWAPFWFRIFRELKLKVLLSDQTTSSLVNQGLESVVSEPCFPIQAAHGHLRWLIDRNVDYILIPNYIAAPGNDPAVVDFYCPWNMTLPYVAQAAPFISHYRDRIICPSLWFNHGDEEIASSIHESLKKVGLQRKLAAVREAVMKGFAAQQAFRDAIQEEGGRALATLTSHHEHGIILLGRPYNIYDRGINLDVAHKLRTYYGTNVIPLDFLNLEPYAEAQRAVHSNMFWGYGKKILAAAAFVRNKPKLHIIYITNFKCGPDSYIKHFIGEASGRPYLTLQFDGHNNDAGMLTRCEAYLDSKGVLRRWGTTQEEMAAGPSSR